MKAVKNLSVILFAALSVVLILWTNFQIIGGWFGKQGPADLGSIEVSYISMARFLVDFGTPFTGATWNPLWYFGFPTHLFYTPLLPFIEAFLHIFFNLPYWEAYRFVTGMGFILAPVSLFLLGWQLSKRVIGGSIAGILFSVSPTIMYWLNSGVASDRFSLDFLDPRRYTILVRWGEGPHTFSLVFVPLVGFFFARFLDNRRFLWIFMTAVFLGLAGLTNAIGLLSSIVIISVMTFVKIAHDQQGGRNTLLSAIGTGLLAFGFISFWYNFSFIKNFFAEGGGTGKLLVELFPWGWVGGIILVVLIYWLIRKVVRDFALAVSLLLFFIFFIVVYVYYSTGTMELLPQALRYNVEVDLSVSLLLGVAFAKVIGLLAKKIKAVEIAGNVLGIMIIAGLILYIQPFFPVAYKNASKVVDLKQTGEYEIANWLDNHVNKENGERVFLPGSYGFYLDWFTNVWQHRGALYQASIHPWPDHMHYQMATGKDADIARAWLVIANARYAVITGDGTRELYKEIKHPERFESYNPVYSSSGDTIFEVPLKKPAAAKVVNLGNLENLKSPKKGDDKKALLSYADWIENSSQNEASFDLINNDVYQIKGKVEEGEGILVQMASDGGWHARDTVTGENEVIDKDPLSFMVLRPKSGNVDITLTHGKTSNEWVGYFISFAALLFSLWFAVFGKKIRS